MSGHKLQRHLSGVLVATLALAWLGPQSFISGQGAAPLSGSIYYVAPTGDDANPGTEIQPWKTIQRAANTLVAGDSVYLRAGTYREMVVPRNSGTDSDHYITYAAYPGETVTIDGTRVSVPIYAGLFYLVSKNYIRISGLHIINSPAAGILVENSGQILIEKNNTYNTGSSGIGVWGSHNIIINSNDIALACSRGIQESLTVAGTDTFEVKNNRVHNDNVPGYDKEGINLKAGSTNGSVYRNLVYQTKVTGIYVDAWNASTGNINIFQNVIHDASSGIALAAETGGLLDRISIYNNVSYNNRYAGLFLSGCCAGVPSHPIQNITIINNTFYNNGEVGIGLYDNPDIQNITVRNNVVSQNHLIQIAVSGIPTGMLTVDHNLVDGNRARPEEFDGAYLVAGNPQFVNPSAADFHLLPSSPAVNKGSALDAPSDDFDGNSRPQGAAWDIGAYEVRSLVLRGFPADRAIHLDWEVAVTLPTISTWQITYDGPPGSLASPITGVISSTRAYILTNLTNYRWYTITLKSIPDSTPMLIGTVSLWPTDEFVYLPVVRSRSWEP